MLLVYTTVKDTSKMTSDGKSSKNRFSKVWGNPFSKSQQPRDISEHLEALRVSGVVAEGNACRVIMEKMKTQAPSLFFTANVPGAVGLERKFNVEYLGENGDSVRHLDLEITEKVSFETMKFEDIESLHGLDAATQEFKLELFKLLRSINFLDASVSLNSVKLVITKIKKDLTTLTGEMNGKIGSNGHIKHFSFTGRSLKVPFKIRNEEYTITLTSNPDDQSVFFRLNHVESSSTFLPKYVRDMCLIFPCRPRLTIQQLKHPKLIPSNSVFHAKQFDEFNGNVFRVFANLALQIAEGQNDTTKFFNKRVPVTRYVTHEKENFRAKLDTLPYDSYICHFSRCVHDMARMQYVYTVLYSVTAALLREYESPPARVFDVGSMAWTPLINSIRRLIDERDASYDLRNNIACAAALASHVYETVCKQRKTALDVVDRQLRNLYTTDCGIAPQGGLYAPNTFGHLLATYAFENAPLHVVCKTEDRNLAAVERTFYTDQQKLYIMKLTLGDDNQPYNHGRRWSMSVVAGSKREFFFDLEEIMIPGSKAESLPGKVEVQAPSSDYWCDQYDVNGEEHKRYGLDRQSLISIKLNSTHEMKLCLDVPYTDIEGVRLGDETKAKKYGPKSSEWLDDGESTGEKKQEGGDDGTGGGDGGGHGDGSSADRGERDADPTQRKEDA
jgi:hypothetical protein